MTLFHIAARDDWERAQHSDVYDLGEAFLHLSERHQVLRPANLLYRGRSDLVLLVIDQRSLPGESLVYEPGSHGEADDFPHLYAPLPRQAVIGVVDFPCADDGSFELPDGI